MSYDMLESANIRYRWMVLDLIHGAGFLYMKFNMAKQLKTTKLRYLVVSSSWLKIQKAVF